MEPTTPSPTPETPAPQIPSPTPDFNTPMGAPAPVKSGSKKALWIALAVAIPVLIVAGAVIFNTISRAQSNAKKTSSQPAPASTAKTPTTAKNKYANCLTKADLAKIQGDAYTLKDIEGVYYAYLPTFFFKPDSTTYEYADQVAEDLAGYQKVLPGLSDKDWTMELQGQIKDISGAGNTAANKKLANDRANKVKDEFVKVGVAASRIKLLEPEIYDSTQIAPDDSDRNVSANIQSRCADTQIEPDN